MTCKHGLTGWQQPWHCTEITPEYTHQGESYQLYASVQQPTRQHRTESSAQSESSLRYSKRRHLVVFGIAERSACTTPDALAANVQGMLLRVRPAQQRLLSTVPTAWASGRQLRGSLEQCSSSLLQCQQSIELLRPSVAPEPSVSAWMRIPRQLRSSCNSARACSQSSFA